MRKRFKSIMALLMAMVIMLSMSVSAMAASPIPEEGETKFEAQALPRIIDGSGSANYKGSQVMVTSMWIIGPGVTLKHYITGPSGQWVNVKLVHRETGDTRHFTGIAGAGWLSDSYNVPLRSGYWDVYIIGAGAHGTYSIQISVLHT